jgi:A/G-specific adenine glycosylase
VRKWRVPRTQKIPVEPWNAASPQLRQFQTALLAWFRTSKRDLPWRRNRDAYEIWISEIMLQQTRVAAVIPYYERFLARFPDVSALARSRIESVLRHWAGLGYYSRARNLHRAAREIVARHAGEFPRNAEAALGLAGIGQYTAAAVLSIAYGVPLAVLDGNVARVLARLGAIRGDLREPRRWQGLASAADRLLTRDHAGDWNQAMMELGATICAPRAPRCPECPVGSFCRARALRIVDEVPEKRRKRETVRVVLAAAVFLDAHGETLLVRPRGNDGSDAHNADGEDSDGLFSRLWQFPAVEVSPKAAGKHKDDTEETACALLTGLRKYCGTAVETMRDNLEPLPTRRHTVTFREITLVPFLVRVAGLPRIPEARTLPLDDINRLPVSSATRKIAAVALRSCKPGRTSGSSSGKQRDRRNHFAARA